MKFAYDNPNLLNNSNVYLNYADIKNIWTFKIKVIKN